jgi:hypothetical protein
VQTFSASRAIGSGFRLIAREPKAILAWSAAYLALAAILMLLMSGMLIDVIGYYQSIFRASMAGETPDPAGMWALQSRMLMLQPLYLLFMLVVQAVLFGAVARAMLTPDDRRYFYLRLGKRELWLGLVSAVLWVLAFLMFLVLAICCGVGAAIAVGAQAGHSGGLGGIVVAAFFAAGLVAIAWVLIRLSLAVPMTFAEKRFRVTESWALTRSQVFKMFVVALAVGVIVWLIEMILGAVILSVVLGVAGHGQGLSAYLALEPADLMRRLLPLTIGLGVVVTPIGVAMMVVLYAPLVEVYRALNAGSEGVFEA